MSDWKKRNDDWRDEDELEEEEECECPWVDSKGKVCHADGDFLLHKGVCNAPGKIAFPCAYLAP